MFPTFYIKYEDDIDTFESSIKYLIHTYMYYETFGPDVFKSDEEHFNKLIEEQL